MNPGKFRQSEPYDLCVVGGAGHVGLPLSIVFASKGLRVLIHDVNQHALDVIASGTLPFMERGAGPLLRDALAKERLGLSSDPADVAHAANVVVVIGTPVDEFLNPSLKPLMQCLDTLLPYLSDEQLLILRSTVYPGVTDSIGKYLQSKNKLTQVAFCPERIVQGHAVEELQSLPQLVSGTTPEAEDRAARLFSRIAPRVLRLAPIEAELVKLFSNAYRYIQFAITNQFYLIADAAGADYFRILEAMKDGYPRMADVPGPGFAAGPVPVQGHHAAGGVLPQPVQHRPVRDAGQRGPALVRRRPPGSTSPARGHDGRPAGHGVQGRQRRPALVAQLQGQEAADVPGQGSADDRSATSPAIRRFSRSTRSSRAATSWCSARRTASTGTSSSSARSSWTSGICGAPETSKGQRSSMKPIVSPNTQDPSSGPLRHRRRLHRR